MQSLSLPAIFLASVFLVSCAAPKPGTTTMIPTPTGVVEGVSQPVDGLDRTHLGDDIPVFIVSSRSIEENPMPGAIDPFGTERSHQRNPHLAIAKVGVGEGLSSEQIYRETVTDVKRKKTHFTLKEVKLEQPMTQLDPSVITPDDLPVGRVNHPWLTALRRQLDQDPDRHIVIYVHGFNTHLVTNTELAAEFFHYMGRKGAVLSFEWPSAGKLLAYSEDKNRASQSTRLFRGLIAHLASLTGAKQIDIIAHSAGNPIVVNALHELRLAESDRSSAELQKKYGIHRVILAAPDMDLVVFFNAVYDRFYEIAGGVSVYASPNDKALNFSSMIFKDRRLGRSIGELEDWETRVLAGVREIEMIDVSVAEAIYGGGSGHSYFHRDPWVSTDIGMVMKGFPAQARGLTRSGEDVFWEFPEDYPEFLRGVKGRRQ